MRVLTYLLTFNAYVSASCKERGHNCTECISESFECRWCEDEHFGEISRCYNERKLRSEKCTSEISPQTEVEKYSLRKKRSTSKSSKTEKSPKKEKSSKKTNHKKSDKKTKPRSKTPVPAGYKKNNDEENTDIYDTDYVDINLRAQDTANFNWKFTMPEYQAIDLYFVFDLSYSMRPDLVKLSEYCEKLFDKFYGLFPLEEKTLFHVGLGTFVDKVLMPSASENDAFKINPCLTDPDFKGECAPSYVFKNNMPLEDRNANSFRNQLEEVRNQLSSNIDVNEAGLDALIQATVCKEQIGWRQNTRKMIVYISDAGYHAQGDGFFNGLLRRHDEKCHLNQDGMEIDGDEFDYPSMAQAAQIINDENIMVAFSLTDSEEIDLTHVKRSYEDLANMITSSKLVVVNEAVTNEEAATLIFELYEDLAYRSTVRLPENLPQGVNMKILSATVTDERGNVIVSNGCTDTCLNILPRYTVEYRMEVRHYKGHYESQNLMINEAKIMVEAAEPEGIIVNVRLINMCEDCSPNDDMDCGDTENSYECGVCICANKDPTLMDQCIKSGTTLACSGVGSCRCGKCFCGKNYSGNYCECNELRCGLKGDCGFGTCKTKLEESGFCNVKCKCDEGYTVDKNTGMCSCPKQTTECGKNGNCSGDSKGSCNCNQCICNNIFAEIEGAEQEIGYFNNNDHCNSILPSCSDLLKSDLGEELQCRLSFCKENPSENCFVEADCITYSSKHHSRSDLLNTDYNLGTNKEIEFSDQHYDTIEAQLTCEVEFADLSTGMDRCFGRFSINYNTKFKTKLYLLTVPEEQDFKYYQCSKNVVGAAIGAAIGGICGLTILVGGIVIVLFDQFLKRKEVTDHETEVEKNQGWVDNRMKMEGVTEYTVETTRTSEKESFLVAETNTVLSTSFTRR